MEDCIEHPRRHTNPSHQSQFRASLNNSRNPEPFSQEIQKKRSSTERKMQLESPNDQNWRANKLSQFDFNGEISQGFSTAQIYPEELESNKNPDDFLVYEKEVREFMTSDLVKKQPKSTIDHEELENQLSDSFSEEHPLKKSKSATNLSKAFDQMSIENCKIQEETKGGYNYNEETPKELVRNREGSGLGFGNYELGFEEVDEEALSSGYISDIENQPRVLVRGLPRTGSTRYEYDNFYEVAFQKEEINLQADAGFHYESQRDFYSQETDWNWRKKEEAKKEDESVYESSCYSEPLKAPWSVYSEPCCIQSQKRRGVYPIEFEDCQKSGQNLSQIIPFISKRETENGKRRTITRQLDHEGKIKARISDECILTEKKNTNFDFKEPIIECEMYFKTNKKRQGKEAKGTASQKEQAEKKFTGTQSTNTPQTIWKSATLNLKTRNLKDKESVLEEEITQWSQENLGDFGKRVKKNYEEDIFLAVPISQLSFENKIGSFVFPCYKDQDRVSFADQSQNKIQPLDLDNDSETGSSQQYDAVCRTFTDLVDALPSNRKKIAEPENQENSFGFNQGSSFSNQSKYSKSPGFRSVKSIASVSFGISSEIIH